jgi:hypothetical protein
MPQDIHMELYRSTKACVRKKKPHDGDGEEKLAKDYGLFTKLIIFY